MFRALQRMFSTAETKRLADDVDKVADVVLDLNHKIEGLQRRIERHLNKLQMREARGARGRGSDELMLSEEEERILMQLRQDNGGRPLPEGFERDPFERG